LSPTYRHLKLSCDATVPEVSEHIG